MNKFSFVIILIISTVCNSQNKPLNFNQKVNNQDSIIKLYADDCAHQFNYNFQMNKWQDCLDKGLEKDSTIAYLWQQKAMPYFKARKYEVGMKFIDIAVFYNPKRYQPYRAFIKCIFAKTYNEAIVDFEDCIKKYGNGYEMDHSYKFYIALSYLQLNDFKKAEDIFKEDIKEQEVRIKQAHFLDLFYFGISKFEQNKWEEAIVEFDKALDSYKNFSEAKYYKAICYAELNNIEMFKIFFEEAKKDAEKGYTINEDNSIYEMYPYKVRW